MRYLFEALWLITFFAFGCLGALNINSVNDCSSGGKECEKNKDGKTRCFAGKCVTPSHDGQTCTGGSCEEKNASLNDCEGDTGACATNTNGLTQCVYGKCEAKVAVALCTATGNECAKNTDGKVICINDSCAIPLENQTQCTSDGNECVKNKNGKTACHELVCDIPFVNAKTCLSGGTECTKNKNEKTACVDDLCHIPLVAIQVCTKDGGECAKNTDGNIRCIEDQCAFGHNPNVRVIWREKPSENAIISVSGDHAELFLDGEKRRSVLKDYKSKFSPYDTGEYEDSSNVNYAHFKLKDLKPSTPYYFSVKTDEGISREFYFVTAPNDDRKFKLLYGGDSRSQPKVRRKVNALLKQVAQADSDIIAFVHGGDYNSSSNDWDQWSEWLDDHEIFIADDGRILPMIPTRGNHEGNAVTYNQVFANPGTDDTDYWTTSIGRLLWITLDTNVSGGGDQKEFCRAALKKGQSYRWIVPSYHKPAYPAVKTPSRAFTHWVPLFEEYNVDFVAESDGHVLKRTVPIRDGQKADDGIVYIGEGGLGVSQRTPDTSRWFLQSPGMAISGHHIQRLTFSKTKAVYEAITLDGAIVDKYEFSPRDRK